MPKQSVLSKNCGLLISERFRDNKQKISPILAKRTDFLVHKAQVLVGMTGFEPATSCSQSTRATNCATSRKISKDIIHLKLEKVNRKNKFLQKLQKTAITYEIISDKKTDGG